MSEMDDKRAYPRRTSLTEARVMEDGRWYDCRIINISAGGAKLMVGRSFARDTEVVLEIGKFGRFRGSVVWSGDEELGIKFNHDPAEMAEVVMGTALYG